MSIKSATEHHALDHQLVLGAHEISGRRIDGFTNGHELRLQRANSAGGHVRLTIDVRHFRREIMDRPAQLAHARLEVGAFPTELLQAILLGAKPSLRRLLRGERDERADEAQREYCVLRAAS